MQWFLISNLVLWLSSDAKVHGGVLDPERSGTVIADLDIIEIDRDSDSSITVLCNTAFDNSDNIIKTFSLLTNIYTSGEPEIINSLDNSVDTSCSGVFAEDAKAIEGKDVSLLLQGLDESKLPVVRGTTNKATFPSTLESATLKYSTSEVMLTVTDFTASLVDVIYSNSVIVGNPIPTVTFPVTISPKTDFSVDLIGLDGNTMKDYVQFTIKDYNLLGQAIDSSSLEVRWDFQDSITRYYIKHDKTSGDFQAVSVTCDGGGANIPCFGYFTGLTPGAYTVSVQPKTGTPPNDIPDEKNKIESKKIDVPTLKFSNRQIQPLQLNWHYNEQSENLDVCFSHTSHFMERVFSHYEFVLINKTGQWLKHKLQTQDTEGDLCFTTFGIPLEDFDASNEVTLIVTQRAEDGFTVLASGKASVTFI